MHMARRCLQPRVREGVTRRPRRPRTHSSSRLRGLTANLTAGIFPRALQRSHSLQGAHAAKHLPRAPLTQFGRSTAPLCSSPASRASSLARQSRCGPTRSGQHGSLRAPTPRRLRPSARAAAWTTRMARTSVPRARRCSCSCRWLPTRPSPSLRRAVPRHPCLAIRPAIRTFAIPLSSCAATLSSQPLRGPLRSAVSALPGAEHSLVVRDAHPRWPRIDWGRCLSAFVCVECIFDHSGCLCTERR